MENYAYISLATTQKYLAGVRQLYNSYLDTHSKYPMYIMITNETNITGYEDLPFIVVNKIIPKYYKLGKDNHVSTDILCKFNLWQLNQFDKILYLDADCIFKQNSDEIFNDINNFLVIHNEFGVNRTRGMAFGVKPDYSFFIKLLTELNSYIEPVLDEEIYYKFYKTTNYVSLFNHCIIDYILHEAEHCPNNKNLNFGEKYWDYGFDYKDMLLYHKK